MLEEVGGFGFGGVELAELFEDFTALFEFVFGDEAAGETATGLVEVGVVACLGGEFSFEAFGEGFDSVFVGEAVVSFGEGDIAFFKGEFGEDAIGFEEAPAVSDEVEEFVAGDFEFGTGYHVVDLFEVKIAVNGTGRGFESEFSLGDFFQGEESGLPVGGFGEASLATGAGFSGVRLAAAEISALRISTLSFFAR